MKKVIVTGGSSGIGKQLAVDMLGLGYQVAIIANDLATLHEAEIELSRVSPEYMAIFCDVRNGLAIQDSVAKVLEKFGAIDILVNNAGYATYRTFEESSVEELLDIYDVNLLGSVRFIKEVLPFMKRRGSGHIVNIASVAGKIVITPNAAYCSSKFAITALSKALSHELKPFGILVSAIYPGRVETRFFDHETFRKRTLRTESKRSIPVAKVSRAIQTAILKHRSSIYVPWHFGLIVWLLNSFSLLLMPIYGWLLDRRVTDLLKGKNK